MTGWGTQSACAAALSRFVWACFGWSILGPLLFIIYINDITKCLVEYSAKLYADDIEASGTDFIDVMLSLRIEMPNIIAWLRLNKLTLNVKKTKLIIFGTPH